MSSYTLTINGNDRTVCIGNRSVIIDSELGSSASTMEFSMVVRDGGSVPKNDEEVIITQGSSTLFGGRILKTQPVKRGSLVVWEVSCVDYTRDLDRNLVVEGYEDMTDKEIIEDIVDNYCGGTGITYDNVVEGVTISNVVFNYMPPSECLSSIAKMTGRQWYIDYDKDIHYSLKNVDEAPFGITGSEAYRNLNWLIDNSAVRNRIYVRGGTYLSDTVTIKQVADGEQVVFNLPEKPHSLTVEEGATPKTVGIKNVNDFTEFDYLMSFQEKYVETDTAPSADTVMTFTFKYDIPVLVAVEDKDSIEKYGQLEYIIFDSKINTIDQARERASAELTDYAESLVSATFKTETTGFEVGQYLDVDLDDLDIDARFVVKSVTAQSEGGGKFVYTIKIISAEMLGIINFLIGLLEGDKNSLNISSDEVVDEISTVSGEVYTLVDSTPVLTSHEGAYKYDSDAEWDIAEWDTE
jgi:hypothetical protein